MVKPLWFLMVFSPSLSIIARIPPPHPALSPAGERGRVRAVHLNILFVDQLGSKNYSIPGRAGAKPGGIAPFNEIYLIISPGLKKLGPWDWTFSISACR
jgi:hypothetical protein